MTEATLLDRLRSMDPYDLEEFVGEFWSEMGYATTVLRGSGDRGIDIVASIEDPFERTQLIQVKRYSRGNKIGSQTVREYRTLYDQEPDADTVVLITTGEFTRQARTLARDLDVEILSGEELARLLLERGRSCVEVLSDEEQPETDETNTSRRHKYAHLLNDETGGDESTESVPSGNGRGEPEIREIGADRDGEATAESAEARRRSTLHADDFDSDRYDERVEEIEKEFDDRR